ncbi:hypothetical protein [Leisingera sp.]|uniref:hypothetical protein n=1 Tax=Leisingera sp. TaxID=1879318 RepID=UPI002B27135A|nr:hypothetical protein [Leisingera sp.]
MCVIGGVSDWFLRLIGWRDTFPGEVLRFLRFFGLVALLLLVMTPVMIALMYFAM